MKIIYCGLFVVVTVLFLLLLSSTILPFVIAFIIAYVLEPLVDNLCIKYKLSRSLIVGTIFILFLACVAILLTILLPLLYKQVALLIDQMPIYKTYLHTEVIPALVHKLRALDPSIAEKLRDATQNMVNNIVSMFITMSNNIWEYTIVTINALVIFALVPVILLYVLRDWPKIIEHIYDLFPLKKKKQIDNLLSDINQLLSAYIRGQLNICALLISFYFVGLSIIGIDFGLLLAIISGVLVIIPIIGTVISITITLAIGYFTFGFTVSIAYIIALYIVGHIIESYIMTPRIISKQIGLHPLWIIFAVFAGGNVFGLVGILFAVPIAGIVKILLCHVIDIYKSSALYKL